MTLLGPASETIILILILMAVPLAWWSRRGLPNPLGNIEDDSASRHEELPTALQLSPVLPEALSTEELCLVWRRTDQ